MITLIPYLLTRLFTHNKEIHIEGDEARHLKTAKTFYKMWNNSFYDFHPPLYSFLIKLFSFIMPRYRAGIVISFLSSISLYWVSKKTYVDLGLPAHSINIALLFLAFNYTLIYFSNRIFRYQLFAFLFMLSFNNLLNQHYIFAGITWGLTLLTCSFNGLRFGWVWLIFMLSKGINQGYLETLAIAYYIYLSLWLLPKFWLYSNRKYHPSGLEGKLDIVNSFNLKQLLSPVYFPFSYACYGKKYLKRDFRWWHTRIMGIYGLYPISILITIPFLILVFFTIKGMFLSPFWLIVLTLILLIPSLDLKYRPRNSIMVIPLFGYFMGLGFAWLSEIWLLGGVLALLGGFLYFNHSLSLFKPVTPISSLTSAFLDTLPLDGVLAEGFIAHSIAYHIEKRVVIISHAQTLDQAKLETDLAIKEFNLNYAVFNDKWLQDWDEGYEAIEYIKTFNLIKTITEDSTNYYIYKLK